MKVFIMVRDSVVNKINKMSLSFESNFKDVIILNNLPLN